MITGIAAGALALALGCGGKSAPGGATTPGGGGGGETAAAAPSADMPGAKLFERRCTSCHQGGNRRGPEITAGYNSRAWIRAFVKDPSGDKFFGPTSIDKMKPIQQEGADLDALVEFVYSQSGAADTDAELAARGQQLFDDGSCSDCHSHDYDTEGDVGPNLGKRGTIEVLTEFIGDPGHARWFGDKNEMPRFRKKLDDGERRAIAEYLVWLRDAS